MSGEIAHLGLEVTSNQVRDASTDLDHLTASATKAQQAAQSLTSGTKASAEAARSLASATEAEAQALQRSAAAAKQAANSNKQFNDSLRDTRFATANVAAQLNDIGVQLAGGTSPFLVAIQQGTQLNQILGAGGARAAVSALGGAFLSLLNPISLATIGIIGLGGAAVQYFTSLISDGQKSAEELERQADLVRDIAKRWGEAVPAVKAYVEQVEKAKQAADLKEGGEIVAKAKYDAIREEVQSLQIELADLTTIMDGFGAEAADEMVRVQQAFAELQSKVADNTATTQDAQAVQEALADVMSKYGLPAANELAAAFGALAAKLVGVSGAAKEARTDVAALLAAQDLGPLGAIPPVYSDGGKFINEDELQTVRANATKSQFLIEQERAAKAAGKALKDAATEAYDPWDGLRKVSDDVKEQMRLLRREAEMTDRAYERFGDGVTDIFTGLITGTMDWKDALRSAIPMVMDLFNNLAKVNSLGMDGSSGGGFWQQALGWVGKLFGFADGGAFTPTGVTRFAKGSAFTNTIVTSPTIFRFANGGKIGEMGEAGPEGILPLKRTASGELGVIAANQNTGQSTIFSPTLNIDARGAQNGDDIRRAGEEIMKKMRSEFYGNTKMALQKLKVNSGGRF